MQPGSAGHGSIRKARRFLTEHNEHIHGDSEPNLNRARQMANVAHSIVIKLKEMGLPEEMDQELASLSTDFGDLWAACSEFNELLQSFARAPQEWEIVADHLVDLKSSMQHLAWHLESVREPVEKVALFAYEQNTEP